MTLLGDFATAALRAAPAIVTSRGDTRPSGNFGRWAQSSGSLVWLDNSDSGLPSMSWQDAPTISGWYRGVLIIGATCATLDTWSTAADEHGFPVQTVSPFDTWLYEQPNPEMAKQTFYELIFGHLASAGNAYEYIVPTGVGLPGESWPIAPHRVKPVRLADGRKGYIVDDEFAELDFMYGGQIVHIPGFGYDGLKGYDPVTLAGTALGLAKVSESFSGSQFTEGSVPGGILTTSQELNKEQSETLRQRWEQRHSGARNQNKIAILDRALEYKQIQPTAVTSELLKTRAFQVVELARILGVPPHLMADVERSTSWGSGLEEQGRGFNTYTLNHYISRVEDVHSMTLLGGTPRRQAFDRSPLVEGSLGDLMTAMAAGVNGRILTPDEARRRFKLPPLPEGKGAEVLIPLNIGDSDPANNEPDSKPDPDED